MMTLRTCLFVAVMTFGAVSAPQGIPSFAPNVVDGASYLSEAEKQTVNRMIEDLRSKADVWAAVFIVDELQDESIESLAERAFRTWKLGEKGKDNGLLLVLAMKDRKMRIETGYGLEGDLPDVVAREALDDHLRPYLRENRIQDGILDAFQFLGQKRNAQFSTNERPASAPRSSDSSTRLNFKAGLLAWVIYFFLVAYGAIRHWRTPTRRSLGLRLFFIINPGVFIFFLVALLFGNFDRVYVYFVSRQPQAEALGALALTSFLFPWIFSWGFNRKIERLRESVPDLASELKPANMDLRSAIVFLLIFTIPGAIGIYASGVSRDTALIILTAVVAAIAAMVYGASRKYDSLEAYRAYEKRKKEREEKRRQYLIKSGMAKVGSDGKLEYTAKYYASSRSSGGSSSGSSGSSSSGGGSSGGGGSSSSW